MSNSIRPPTEANKASNQQDAWEWVGIALIVGIPLLICISCCWYNRLYRKWGPFANSPNDEAICRRGHRWKAVKRVCHWCRQLCRKSSSDVENEAPSNESADVFVICDQVDATRYVTPPPPYEVALGMRRPDEGEFVRFVAGSGGAGVMCEFSMPSATTTTTTGTNGDIRGSIDDDCDPPVYCWPAEWTYVGGQLDQSVPVGVDSAAL